MKAKKILLLLAALLLILAYFTGCKSVKKSRDVAEEVKQEQEQTREVTSSTDKVIEYLGDDELKGFVPFEGVNLPDGKSVIIPVESNGHKLELTVTNQGIAYKSKAKPVARSSLRSNTETKEATATTTEVKVKQREQEVIKKTGIRFPWWIWVILIATAILSLLRALNVISNPFKILFK